MASDVLNRNSNVIIDLPDGDYPFFDERYALKEMVWTDAPAELESLFTTQAKANGIDLVAGVPVELNCRMPDFRDGSFLIYIPLGSGLMQLLVPRKRLKGFA